MQFSRMIPSFRATPATTFFVLANIAVYLGLGLLDVRAFQGLGHESFLIDWGANVPTLTFAGQYWRLLASMFMHVNLTHIAMNMLALWSLGRILEPKIGATYFAAIYLLSGLVGSLFSAIWRNGQFFISCGASGAILGVFGVAIVYALKNKAHSEIPISSLVISLLLTFGAGAIANIDNAAHLGGLITGILMTLLLMFAYRYKPIKNLLLALFFALPVCVLVIGYHHYYDGKMVTQLKLAQLSGVLGSIGLGESSSVISGMPSVNECIDAAVGTVNKKADLVGLSRQVEQQLITKLKACNTQTKNQKDFIATAAPRQFSRCHALAGDLSSVYHQPEEQQFWEVLGNYCQAHGDAYRTVYQSVATINPKQYVDSTYKLAAIVQPVTTEEVRVNSAFVRIFSKLNPLAIEVVRESRCPYTSCKRF